MTSELAPVSRAPQVIDLVPSPDLQAWQLPPPPLPTRRDRLAARLLALPPLARATLAGGAAAETASNALYTAGRQVGLLLAALRALTESEPALAAARTLRRFVRGEPLSGQARTDASLWRRGRRQLPHVEGHTGPWSYKAGIERAAVRFAILADLYAAGRFLWPGPTLTIAATFAALGLVWALWRLHGAAARRQHHRQHLIPLHRALKDLVRTTAAAPEDWLHIPLDYRSDPSRIRIDLPAHFGADPRLQEHLVSVVRNKLALDPTDTARFHLAGARPHVTFHRPARPPNTVGLADVLELLDTASDHAPIIGLAADRRPVTLDLKAESPHFLASAGTGGGKSTLLRALLAQGLRSGALGVILDVKQFSHMWATNLPNVRYCVTAAEIHDTLLWLLAECQNRTAYVRAHTDPDGNTDHIDAGPRIYVLCEEMNATTAMLQTHWRKIKQKGDPLTSPAVVALQFLSYMGRGVKMHLLLVAQRGSAQAVGGADMRENFDIRALTRYSIATWRILAPQIWPPPPKSLHPGRWQLVHGDHATETQVLYLSARGARELALAGHDHHHAQWRSQPPPAPAQIGIYSDELREQPATPTTVGSCVAGCGRAEAPAPGRSAAPAVVTPPDGNSAGEAASPTAFSIKERRLIGLRQAIQEHVVTGMSLTALRKCRERDPDFPKVVTTRGQEMLHDKAELAAWSRNRSVSSERSKSRRRRA